MRVQHNIASMNSYRNYNNNTRAINKNLEKLSSGYKINRAGDDAAGLAISEKMRAQITGLEMAQKNAKDGISLVQTAEGALTEVHSMLNRMFSLAEQSANGTYSNTVDREQLQKEVDQLRTEINRIADSSNFNGMKLLDGSMAGTSVKVGATDKLNMATGGVSFAFASDLDDDTKETFNEFLGSDGKDVTFKLGITGSGTSTAVTVTVSGLTGYKLGAGTGITASDGGGTIQLVGGSAQADYTKPLSLSITNSDGSKTIGTLKVDLSNSTSAANNDTSILKMSYNEPLTLQIGDTADSFNQMSVEVGNVHADALGIDSIDISKQGDAQTAMDAIKAAINTVSDIRGGLGAIQNRLEHTINNLSVMQENIQDAESTIRDTDVADEMMKYTKNSILVQSAQAMLAQANQQPQGVLQLLQ